MAGELALVVRAEAPRRPHVVYVGQEHLREHCGLQLALDVVKSHPPGGSVHEHDSINRSAKGRFIRTGQVNVDRLHWRPRARGRSLRQSSTYTFSFQEPATWLQHTREGDTLLLGRFPPQTFDQMTGGKVRSFKVNPFPPLSNGKGA